MKRLSSLLAGALLALSFSIVPHVAGAADPYEINTILGLTGGYAFVGNGLKQGLDGYAETINKSGGINGRPIKFVYSDDQSNPQVAVQLVNGLIAKKVPLILGPTGVANCNAVAPLVKDGPALYCLSPGFSPAAGSYIFSVSVGPTDLQVAETKYVRERGFKRIAFLASTDGAGQQFEHSEDLALALPENKDIQVVAREHFAPNDVTVTAQVARIKAANPQIVFVLCTGTPVGTVLRSVQDVGLDVPFMLANSNATYAQMKQYAAFLPKDMYFPNQTLTAPEAVTDKGVKDALNVYIAKMTAMGLKPDIQGMGWDAGLIVAAALKKTGLNPTSDQLRDAIAGLRNLPGATGRYDFKAVPQRGIGVDGVIMQRWNAEKNDWVAVGKPGGGI
jgi:branched-chain amino acid transport system substrate-binding protein